MSDLERELERDLKQALGEIRHLRILNADLLAACERFLSDWSDDRVYQCIPHTTADQARAAIAKARSS